MDLFSFIVLGCTLLGLLTIEEMEAIDELNMMEWPPYSSTYFVKDIPSRPVKDIKWSAYILLESNRLTKVEFICKSNLKQDAEQKCKALYGVSDVRQLKREWN